MHQLLGTMKIKGKLVLLTIVSLIGFLIYFAYSYTLMNKIRVNGPIYRSIIMNKDLVADILPPPEYIIETYLTALQIYGEKDPQSQWKLLEKCTSLKKEYENRHAFWVANLPEGELKQRMVQASYEPAKEFFDILERQFFPAIKDGNRTLADELMNGKMKNAFNLHRDAIDNAVVLANTESNNLEKNTKSLIARSSVISVAVMLISVICAVFLGIYLTVSITRPLKLGVDAMSEIARGNLTVTFDERALTDADETGILTRAMKEMADKLKSTISYSLSASENVSSGSLQLSTASQGISQGSSKQASSIDEISASIEEISTSIEEMTASINQNAENANQTEKIAIKSSSDAKEGGEAVQKTVTAMKQIAEKISIIQEIARQTNLLSLNASIEAARAGEHGKGFAVVASAVQKLAERSQDAAEEISKLSKTSVDVAETAGDMLKKLVPDIQKTAELVSEINAASSEQNKGIQQVNSAVQQVNTSIQQFNVVVQSNASASEELASTSEELSAQAEELKNRISYFQIDRTYKNNDTKVRRHTTAVKSSPLAQNSGGAQTVLKERPESLGTDECSKDQKSGIIIDMSDDDENFRRI